MEPISRRGFLQGLAALATVASVAMLPKGFTFVSDAWEHQQEYHSQYLAWIQSWRRYATTADGKHHQWHYMLLTTERWEDTPYEIQEFHRENRDYYWEKAVKQLQGQSPNWMLPIGQA